MVKDPVCGMMIDEKTAAGQSDYQIWLETVGEGHGSAILIEDGRVA